MWKWLTSIGALTLIACTPSQTVETSPKLETVLTIDRRPGNVVSMAGETFATIHPFAQRQDIKVIKVTGVNSYRPWPNASMQTPSDDFSGETFDSPFGIVSDRRGGIWIVDAGFNTGTVRVWHFDQKTGKKLNLISVKPELAGKGHFVQDIAVDVDKRWVFLADISPPGIIAIDLTDQTQRRFESAAMQPERNAPITINGHTVTADDKPNLIGINPITYHAKSDTLFFGAMSGRSWYALPAKLLREGVSDTMIETHITRVGPKPISDGADTTPNGDHYITNLNENGIDVLRRDGALLPMIRDQRLDWVDNIRISDDGYGYMVVNQLHKTAALNNGKDTGTPPYYIFRSRLLH